MLLRPWNTRLCALKLTLHHAVGEGHDIAFARCRKRDDRPSDLLSAFVFIGGEPEYKGGGGECLIHNFDLFGTESCPLQETDYFHEVVPELPGAHMGSIQPPTTGFLENVHEWRAARTGTKDVSRHGGIRHAEVAFITLGAKDSADRTRMSWALYWNTFVLLRDGYHWPIIGGRTAADPTLASRTMSMLRCRHFVAPLA
jgi:hypothetical protein